MMVAPSGTSATAASAFGKCLSISKVYAEGTVKAMATSNGFAVNGRIMKLLPSTLI